MPCGQGGKGAPAPAPGAGADHPRHCLAGSPRVLERDGLVRMLAGETRGGAVGRPLPQVELNRSGNRGNLFHGPFSLHRRLPLEEG